MRSAKFDVEDPSGAGAVSLLTEAFRVHGVFDILPALKKRRGFLRSLVWFQPEHFRRVPVSSIGLTAPHLRRLHIGACPALARSCDKRTIHQNPAPYRLAYKRSRATALKRTAPSSMTCENKEGGPATGPALLLQIVI